MVETVIDCLLVQLQCLQKCLVKKPDLLLLSSSSVETVTPWPWTLTPLQLQAIPATSSSSRGAVFHDVPCQHVSSQRDFAQQAS